MSTTLTFAGAAETVTGSCHFVDFGGTRVVLDCGLFQGRREIEARNRRPFPFEPAEVDFVLLSHAHLDHTGRLPMLAAQGFRGRIVGTSATRDLTRLILLDSARLQAADARRDAEKGRWDGRDEAAPHAPLYGEADVLRCLERFRDFVRYDRPVELGSGLTVVFRDAGHVVGSAFVELTHVSGGVTRRLTFSGDLGNVDKPIVNDPAPRQAGADLLVMEATYGQRSHRPFSESVAELRGVVAQTFERGGAVVIPAFALERSQELLYVLHAMWKDGLLGRARVYLDSPMAIEITGLVQRHPECFDAEILEMARLGERPFGFENLTFTRHIDDSKRINADRGPCIIVSAAGMCTGGRIRHHLRQRLPGAENAVVFIGYQAEGTLGRQLVDGARQVVLFDAPVPVRASVHTLGGFSGHAGCDGLLGWLGSAELPERVALVHAEAEAITAFTGAVRERFGLEAIDPAYGQTLVF
jgi:metallo-beta-lactamase family protein